VTCHRCGSSKLSPSSVKKRSRRCARCVNASPAGKAARRRYMRKYYTTPAGRAAQARHRGRRIEAAGRYWGTAATPALAEQLKAYVRQRVTAFTQEQKHRYATQPR
jgi:hypothetical protein